LKLINVDFFGNQKRKEKFFVVCVMEKSSENREKQQPNTKKIEKNNFHILV
jgi:hypothetical protein